MSVNKLSTDEAELYDRQIRLWGIESQEKLRSANVLLINARGLGSEIAKDVLLSGINSLTILDSGVVDEKTLSTNFLLSKDSIGLKVAEAVVPKAQALNPLVKISSDTDGLSSKKAEFFAKFTIVIATGLSKKELLQVSKACHENKVKFISGDNFGTFGCSITDFQEHEFFEDKVQLVGGQKRTHDGVVTKIKADRVITKAVGKVVYPEISEVFDLKTIAKRRNSNFYLMLILLEFRDKFNRDPNISTKSEDVEALKEIAKNLLVNVVQKKIDQAISNLPMCFGEIVPVCSIVGGVVAQEVIKAVSGKEVPINNVFLLDPQTYDGREEMVGVNASQPIFES